MSNLVPVYFDNPDIRPDIILSYGIVGGGVGVRNKTAAIAKISIFDSSALVHLDIQRLVDLSLNDLRSFKHLFIENLAEGGEPTYNEGFSSVLFHNRLDPEHKNRLAQRNENGELQFPYVEEVHYSVSPDSEEFGQLPSHVQMLFSSLIRKVNFCFPHAEKG